MRCPYCDTEMEPGTAAVGALQGFAHVAVSYTPNYDLNGKKPKSKYGTVLSGKDVDGYYCPCCQKLFPALDLD